MRPSALYPLPNAKLPFARNGDTWLTTLRINKDVKGGLVLSAVGDDLYLPKYHIYLRETFTKFITVIVAVSYLVKVHITFFTIK